MELELILGFIGVGATVVASVTTLAYWLGRKFAQMDAKFAQIDAKFAQMDAKFKDVDAKFSGIDAKLAGVDAKFGGIDAKLTGIDIKFKEMDARFDGLVFSIVESNRLVVEFLGVKGLISGDEASYLIKRIEALVKAKALTAITKEEWDFIKDFISRAPEGVTEEEADRVYEIARDWWLKEPREFIAFQIAMAATYVKAYIISKRVREKKQPTS